MLPQYQFVSLLGRGGMGAVYKAVQVTLDRPVAIKVLPVDLIEDDDAQFAERFKNEARTMAKMNHPAIVNVYDFGETNTGLLYIVMEFIDGTDVAQMIATQGKLPEDYALSISAHVSDALNYAHARGVIHRDIKPANILINMEGAVKVADFGLAKQNDPGQSGITKTNMAMGTPDFVAPEAFIEGVPLDGRADLYAMGVMLYQMLTGEIPRGMWKLPGTKMGTDPRFDAIITKAMQTDREHRYQSAADLRRDLDTILTLPRAALIAQQQAAAEAAARETQAQRQAASGPQRRPVSDPSHEEPPPIRKKSSLGPVLGILSSVLIVAGLFYMLTQPAADRTATDATPAVAVTAPEPAPVTDVTSRPSPTQEPMTEPPPTVVNAPSPPTPAPQSSLPPGWTDLLAGVDVQRDAVNGNWEMTPDGLAAKGGTMERLLLFQQSPPEEYDYQIEFSFNGKDYRRCQMVLPLPHGAILWSMAGGLNSNWFAFGPNLDGKDPDRPERSEAVVFRPKLDSGHRYRCLVEVRKDSLRALLDGEEVMKWSGDLKRFSAGSVLKGVADEHRLGVHTYRTTLTIHKAEVRPVTDGVPAAASGRPPAPVASVPAMPAVVPAAPSPASPIAPSSADPLPPGWTDLLSKADPAHGAVTGQWQKGPDGLVVKAQPGVLPFDLDQIPSEQYDFEMDFTVHSSEPDVAHILPLPGGHWFMARLTARDCYFGQFLDGQQPADRKEGYAPDAKLVQGRRHRSLVQIRKDSVRLLLDEKEVIVFNGDLKRLTPDGQFALRNPAHLGIASHQADVTFHRIGFRPHDPSRMDKTDKDTLLAFNPRLAQLEAGFQTRYQADAEKPFLAALAQLNQSYLTNGVAKARAVAQSRGSLKEVVAFDEVKARIERGEGVPEEDEPGTPESLKSLRAIYRNAMAKITAERDAKAAPLYDVYLTALDAYVTELTRMEKIDEADKVKRLRAEIAGKRPQIQVAAVPEKPETKPPSPTSAPTTTNPSATAVSSGSSWRTAALYLVNNGGSCTVEKSGARISVRTEEEIPSGKFDVVELNLDRFNSLFPPLKDADLLPLAGLRDVRSVWIRPMEPGLTDAGMAFLAANSDLNSLHLEGAPGMGDGLLAHLSGAKKLQFFHLNKAPRFTGTDLRRMPFLNSLREFTCEDAALGDEALAALAQCRNLDVLRVGDGKFTDSGFTALQSLKSLRVLSIYRTAFSDEAVSAIAALSNLTELNLGDTKITDLGLAKLRSLKKLTSLNLTGTQVTVEGAEAFQKLMPQCRVSR